MSVEEHPDNPLAAGTNAAEDGLPAAGMLLDGKDQRSETGEIRLQGAALMSTALRLTPEVLRPPTSSRRFPSGEYGVMQRRLGALSRISSRLPGLTNEGELLNEVVDSLLTY